MLLREDDRGVLAIGQPSHAWVSGQLARAWGNEVFGTVTPREEVCLAAEQHDIGWAARDLEPFYNPDTRLPRSFVQMPLDVHLELWRAGPRALLAQSRYAALLVSMHGWRLYERRDLGSLPPEQATAIGDFLAEQSEFQDGLLGELRADAATGPASTEALLERNSMLLWTWDYLSLGLCLGWPSATASQAPTADGDVDLELSAAGGGVEFHVDPWPFAEPRVKVRCEGRRLGRRFDSEEEMRAAFAEARWETLELRLTPG